MTPEDTKKIAEFKNTPDWNNNISILAKIESIESKYLPNNSKPKPLSKKIPLSKLPKSSYIKCDEVGKIFTNLRTLWSQFRETKDQHTMMGIRTLQTQLEKYRIKPRS